MGDLIESVTVGEEFAVLIHPDELIFAGPFDTPTSAEITFTNLSLRTTVFNLESNSPSIYFPDGEDYGFLGPRETRRATVWLEPGVHENWEFQVTVNISYAQELPEVVQTNVLKCVLCTDIDEVSELQLHRSPGRTSLVQDARRVSNRFIFGAIIFSVIIVVVLYICFYFYPVN